MAKSKERSSKIWSRVGYRSIYNQLLEMKAFETQGLSTIHAIKSASFEEAIYLISLHNAVN